MGESHLPGWFNTIGVMELLGISEEDVYTKNSPAMLNRLGFIIEQRHKAEGRKKMMTGA
jgi:hypothetical protein